MNRKKPDGGDPELPLANPTGSSGQSAPAKPISRREALARVLTTSTAATATIGLGVWLTNRRTAPAAKVAAVGGHSASGKQSSRTLVAATNPTRNAVPR